MRAKVHTSLEEQTTEETIDSPQWHSCVLRDTGNRRTWVVRKKDCNSQSLKASVNDYALQRTDEDADRMSTIYAQIATMNDKFEEKLARLENQLCDTATQKSNEI
ncbi:hypothetical protein CHS0354_036328 [Potamilus streckersoni]|uniref:Uncharacterized protein n=1 Tax=Potamilus streckersoni TaxID=2493646 RepID=A0AAE0RMB6_9BIVA|nr:hypothetical protein CHS0354_036328 [Potamilus streckersoni]